MEKTYSHLHPSIESVRIKPKIVQLYIPPIEWRGDPKGHVGRYDAFFFVLSGECFLMIENESYILREGDLAFLPKGKMRSYASMSEGVKLYEINFEAEINEVHWYDALGLSYQEYSVHVEDVSEMAHLFEESVRYELNRSIIYDVILCADIALIMSRYFELRLEREIKTAPFTEVKKYMRDNIGSSVKITELAELSFMQPTYFIKKFKRAYGESPITYFNKMKVYRAMYLLASSELSVLDISKSVGIFDNSYFTKVFRNYTGRTPTEYRASVR